MKTVKILIATALLSTTFYACKKEEMNMKTGEIVLQSNVQNDLTSENTSELPSVSTDLSQGIVKIIFYKIGKMIIEGNPNLENLISMYNASETAIASANKVFEITQQECLTITFDRNGNTISSNVPTVPVGSNIDTFIKVFCQLAPTSSVNLSITKDNLDRNYTEYWNAMPAGTIEYFEASIRKLQNQIPLNHTLQIQILPGQSANVSIVDPNGNVQTLQSLFQCQSNYSGFSYIGGLLDCLSTTNWF